MCIKCCNLENNNKRESNNKYFECSFIFIPILITSIIFIVLDRKNDIKLKNLFKEINYNWNTNPLKSIEISQEKNYEFGKITVAKCIDEEFPDLDPKYIYNLYKWKNNYFKIERLNNFNYFNIYQESNGKLCGKDSYGNNLYFPFNEECPINDIIISNSSFIHQNFKNYKKIDLGSNTFLYYTNKNIEGKIIIDLKINNDKGINLNIEKTNELCDYIDLSSLNISDTFCRYNDRLINSHFYKIVDSSKAEEIDNDFLSIKNSNHNVYLYSIYYLGVNSIIINEKNIINNYKSNIKIYQKI